MYNTDSIYDNYLSADGPRQSQGASTLSGAGAERLSGLAPPIPRNQNGRQTAYSMADTASVYTTATTPFERWSLEDGLEPPEPKSPTSVYAAGGTERPPDSPRLADLRKMAGPARTAPMHTQTPVATSMSPQPVQYSRRHFSRPFRPEETHDQPNMHSMATPKIMVGQHRFSASTPDAYGGASFSPALPQDSPQMSTYASDVAGDDHDFGHLRRRSMPAAAFDDARSGSPTSIYGDERLRAIGGAQRDSMSGSSIAEKEEEFNEKREPHPRPFSLSNTYPFTTGQNGYGSHNMDTVKSLSHKPSSRFSEDEKGIRSVDSTNEFHSSTWNLFGRSPVASPMWRHSDDGRRNLGGQPPVQPEKQKKRRRIIIWVVAVLILLALAGIGAGIGVWRHNVSVNDNNSSAAALDGEGTPVSASGAAARPSSASDVGSEGNDSADVAIPARDSSAVPGSGGPGGYYSLVAFGGSYADNGHSRSDDYSYTLQVAPYDGGRATNGPVFQEYMSSLVGPTADESATVLNYAYSGSSVNNTISTFQAPDFPAQVASYLGDLNNANATVAATAAHKALVTVWAGMDELVQIWESAISSTPGDPQTPALADVRAMLSTMNTTLRWMIPTTGAPSPDFVLIALPRGDILPQTSRLALNNTGYINVFRNMTSAFNTGLSEVAQSLSTSTTVYTLDANGLFDSIYANPSSYNLTSVDAACRDQSCTDPDSFMWFDGMNPSTRMHSLVARHLAATILKP